MNIDTVIDRFVSDVGVIDDFNYFIPAIYDHLLISTSNSITRGFGYEHYIDLINIIQNNPIEFIRRYEAKNDIIFCKKDDEIMEIIKDMAKNTSATFINEKINEFRIWRMKQEIRELVDSLNLDFSKFSGYVPPDLIDFLNNSSENNYKNK